jgi:hypothetical protein
VRAAIGLPRPRKIHHFILGDLAPGALAGDTGSLVEVPTQISGIRVFEYGFSNSSQVRLQAGPNNVLWQCPKPAPVLNTSVAVLHIYNEPGEEMPHQQAADHNLQEFNRTLSYLGAKLTLKVPGKVRSQNSISLPDGLLFDEVAALDRRHCFAVKLIHDLRQVINFNTEIELSKSEKTLISENFRKLLTELFGIIRGGGGGGTGSQVCGGANALVGP